jgi:gas vesicle protein
MELLSGLLGAIIGSIIAGVFSLWGASKSTKTAIKAQKELLLEEFKRTNNEIVNRSKRYAKLVETEIVLWILYSVHRLNIVESTIEKRADTLDFNSNYRLYIDAFIDQLTIDESHLIIELYGLIKKININLENQSYIYSNSNTELNHSMELLILKVFSKEFLDEYKKIDPSYITRDSVLSKLNKETKFLINKLNSISELAIYIN